MSDSMKKRCATLVVAVLFVVFLALVVIGQRSIRLTGIATMLVGLAGLIFLLWLYNRKYK